jgi:hypothetical protein
LVPFDRPDRPPRSYRALGGLLGIALAWLSPCAARADDASGETFRFVWVRAENAEGCSSDAEMARAVTERLGRLAFSEKGARSIEGVVQHEGDVWEVRIYLRDARGSLQGSRTLRAQGPTCAPVEAAASLAIALAIDSEAASPVAASAAAPVPPVPPAVPRSVTPPPEHKPPALSAAPPPRVAGWGAVTFRGLASAGLLPSLAPGLALAAELPVRGAMHAAGGMLYLPEQRTSDAGFAFGMTAAWLGGCFLPVDLARTSLSLCAMAEGGAIHAVVLSLSPLSPGDRPWVAGSVEAVLRLRPAGPLLAEIGGDFIVPFTRDRFVLEPQPATTVFRQGPVAGTLFVGAGMLFP